MNEKTIIVTSNEPWGDVWFSKQHYAFEFTKLGHQVYFINPTQKWKLIHIFSFKANAIQVNEKLKILNYKNNFPQGGKYRFFVKINDILNRLKLKKQIKINNHQIIWWKFDPYRFLKPSILNKGKVIYHVVDPYLYLWQDPIQAKNANLIVCTSSKYVNYYKGKSYKNVIKIPHGISEDEFNLDKKKIELIRQKYNDFAIIIGSITSYVNIDLLRKIASEQINVVIIGPEVNYSQDWSTIKKMKHIHYIGKMHAKDLKNYIAAAKTCLISYDFIPKQKEQIRSPLKTLNYLAQNKVIITSIDPETPSLENECIYWAKDSTEYITLVKKAMDSELGINEKKIKTYLYEHQYSKLISEILIQLEKC